MSENAKEIPTYSQEQEREFLEKNVLGRTVSEVAVNDCGVCTIAFDDTWAVDISGGAAWFHKKPQ